jgi:hypothetical protein
MMKMRVLHRRKLALLLIAVCAVMLASSHDARADRIAIPPIQSVPDGGATVMLLGTALGALGLVRRYLVKR